MPKVYKATEVCELAGLQPYILRSWEKEFPRIGVQRSPDGPRLYRQSDVDQVLRIKQLVFGEGLTLAGARRRLGETVTAAGASEAEMAEVLEALGADARARIAAVRNGLRSILDVLSKAPGSVTRASAPAPQPGRQRPMSSMAAKRTVASTRAALARKTTRGVKRKRASA